jgi:hypothetical protein
MHRAYSVGETACATVWKVASRPLLLGLAALAAVPALAAVAAAQESPDAGARARATVDRIAALGPRPAGAPGAESAVADLVAERFRGLGYRVVRQPVRLPNGRVSSNVVAVPDGASRVVLTAHYDGVRGTPAANDNGSGVAVLLELAAALRDRPGVLLAATAAEERAQTKSKRHLGSLRLLQGISPAARRGVRLAATIDMVGVGTRLHVRGLEARPNRSARLLLRGGGATYLRDSGLSDHAEQTRGGLPAAWVQWRDDRCWHAPCDVARRVNPRRLQAAYDVVLRAANSALR